RLLATGAALELLGGLDLLAVGDDLDDRVDVALVVELELARGARRLELEGERRVADDLAEGEVLDVGARGNREDPDLCPLELEGRRARGGRRGGRGRRRRARGAGGWGRRCGAAHGRAARSARRAGAAA